MAIRCWYCYKVQCRWLAIGLILVTSDPITAASPVPLHQPTPYMPNCHSWVHLFIIIAIWTATDEAEPALKGKHKRNCTTTRLAQLWRPPQIRYADKVPGLSSSGKLAPHFVQYRRVVLSGDEFILQDASRPFQQDRCAPNPSVPRFPGTENPKSEEPAIPGWPAATAAVTVPTWFWCAPCS